MPCVSSIMIDCVSEIDLVDAGVHDWSQSSIETVIQSLTFCCRILQLLTAATAATAATYCSYCSY